MAFTFAAGIGSACSPLTLDYLIGKFSREGDGFLKLAFVLPGQLWGTAGMFQG